MATNARQMKMDAITLNPNEGTVLYMREHPTLAAKYLLNVNLNWIQRLAVRNIWTKSFGMLIWGRRNGKTFVGAIACVLRALLFPGERVLIVAPSKRQVDWIFMNEIIPLFNNSGYFRASVNGKINITTSYNRIKFANGSTIEGFPVGTEGGKIRGAGCVVSGTYILTDSGMKKIVDIYKTEKEYKIQTRFGLEDILVYAKNKKKKIKKIITKRGYTLSGLGEHLLLTITDGIKDYKYLSDLKIGDKVCLDIKDKWPDIKYFDCSNIEEKKPRNCPKVTKANNEKPIIFPQYLDENLAVILGYIVSEGSCNQKTVLGMANTDKHVIEDYCSKFEKVFGIKPSVRILSEGVDKRGIKRKITYEASVNRTEIRNFLIDIGLNRAVAKTKSIPFSILESPKSVVISFLRAMYEGDGHARLDSGKYSVGYTTISYELAHTLHVLLSNFGIYGTLRARDRRTKQILNPIKSKNLIYSIDLTGESALKFGRDIGFVTERKNNIINKATVKNSVHRLDDELFYYDEIISIEELEAEFTYDFNIPKEHSYISNGFVSHNCSFLWVDEYAQMSESVINLVFRPMLSVKRKGGYNRYLITSSAYYRWNHMWTLFQYYKIKEFLEPHKYFVLNFNYNHLLLSKNLPVEFDLNIIEEARNNMTDSEFQMEYGGIFPTDIEGFFSSKLIDDCTPKPPDNTPVPLELQGDGKSNYYMGIDVGRAEGGSNFSISIIKKKAKVAHLVNVYTMNGATFQDMVETIRRKFVDFNIMKIKLDAGGGGLTIRDLLREQWIDPYTHQALKPIVTVDDTLQGIPALELVKFTDEIHNSLHMNLKSEMEHGRILFPMDLRRDADKDLERAGIEIVAFKNELRVMTAKPKGKFLRFEVPNKFRTDRVISTALAIDAYIESNRKYEDFDDLAIGSWVSR
jgi:intein/homing endonuclease